MIDMSFFFQNGTVWLILVIFRVLIKLNHCAAKWRNLKRFLTFSLCDLETLWQVFVLLALFADQTSEALGSQMAYPEKT